MSAHSQEEKLHISNIFFVRNIGNDYSSTVCICWVKIQVYEQTTYYFPVFFPWVKVCV